MQKFNISFIVVAFVIIFLFLCMHFIQLMFCGFHFDDFSMHLISVCSENICFVR